MKNLFVKDNDFFYGVIIIAEREARRIIVLRYSGPVNIYIVCNGCGLGSPGRGARGHACAHKQQRQRGGVAIHRVTVQYSTAS